MTSNAAPKKRHAMVAKPVAAAANALAFPAVIAATPKPANTRERILYAAVELLNSEGFGALTQSRVAERAGVRQSHITYYFPARNDLLRETALFGCNAMLEVLDAEIDAGTLSIDNLREMVTADIHDRRFTRLMCALTVASDEDESIKPWLANFENANRARLLHSFRKLGLDVSVNDVEFFYGAFIGALMLDLGEATEESLARAQRIGRQAFDVIVERAKKRALPKSKSKPTKITS
jgi:AcrR family transcriptional regulator